MRGIHGISAERNAPLVRALFKADLSQYCGIMGYPTKEHDMPAIKEYDARIDTKKRLTLRGARYTNYHVQEYPDGRIVLEPRELVAPFELSRRSLAAMDASVENLKEGKASEPIDLASFTE